MHLHPDPGNAILAVLILAHWDLTCHRLHSGLIASTWACAWAAGRTGLVPQSRPLFRLESPRPSTQALAICPAAYTGSASRPSRSLRRIDLCPTTYPDLSTPLGCSVTWLHFLSQPKLSPLPPVVPTTAFNPLSKSNLHQRHTRKPPLHSVFPSTSPILPSSPYTPSSSCTIHISSDPNSFLSIHQNPTPATH